MSKTKDRWNGLGDPPFYVIEYFTKSAKGVVLESTQRRFRPTGYPAEDEALAKAFEIMDNGGIVTKIEGPFDFHLSRDEVKKAYAQRPKS
jgi:hypothetical protein